MSTVKSRLIEATYEEVLSTGYNAASLANILNRAEVKKGAMYHYFPSKKAMVLEMIDEKIKKRVETKWFCLLEENEDEIQTIIKLVSDKNQWDLENGCPLGNLLQESLDNDEEFIEILTSILNQWKDILKEALINAKNKKLIKDSVNTEQCATFLIASIEGALLLTKKSKDNKDFDDCTTQLSLYLNSLRN